MKTDLNFQISIPKSCHEDWNKFTPDPKGAFCKVCSKSVYDFTEKTPGQIKAILEEEMGVGKEVCGRFNSDQITPFADDRNNLNKETPPLDTISLNFRRLGKFALALFLVFGGLLFTTNSAFGQVEMGKVTYVKNPKIIKGRIMTGKKPIADSTTTAKMSKEKCTEKSIKHSIMGTPPNPQSLTMGGVSLNNIAPTALPLQKTIIEPSHKDSIADRIISEKQVIVDSIRNQPIEDVIINPPTIKVTEEILLNVNSLENKTEIEDENFMCYPNPSNGMINLKYSVKEKTLTGIAIYDINGNLIKALLKAQSMYAAEYNSQYDLSELPDGIYFCQMTSGNKRYTKRIILGK